MFINSSQLSNVTNMIADFKFNQLPQFMGSHEPVTWFGDTFRMINASFVMYKGMFDGPRLDRPMYPDTIRSNASWT